MGQLTLPFSSSCPLLPTAEAEQLLLQWGQNGLEEKVKPGWLIFLELMYQPMPIMVGWLGTGPLAQSQVSSRSCRRVDLFHVFLDTLQIWISAAIMAGEQPALPHIFCSGHACGTDMLEQQGSKGAMAAEKLHAEALKKCLVVAYLCRHSKLARLWHLVGYPVPERISQLVGACIMLLSLDMCGAWTRPGLLKSSSEMLLASQHRTLTSHAKTSGRPLHSELSRVH